MDNKTKIINSIKEHQMEVRHIIRKITNELQEKSVTHDGSKTLEPEFSRFVEFLSEVRNYKYGTKEYNDFVANNEYCKYHFALNDHHPEYFEDEHINNGISKMNLINITEMFADWVASSSRNGNITKEQIVENIIKLSDKFQLGVVLTQILINTVDFVITRLQLDKMR